MGSFSTVQAGDPINSTNLNQYADAFSGNANIPISLTGISDASNWALDIRNQETGNSRSFRARDSSGNARLQAGNTSTTYVQADPDGSGLSVVATLSHAQTFSNKTIASSGGTSLGNLGISTAAGGVVRFQIGNGTSNAPIDIGVWSTWTPTFTQSASITIGITRARYRVIGKDATVKFNVILTSTGTAGQALVVGGLPVAPESSAAYNDLGGGIFLANSTFNLYRASAISGTQFQLFVASTGVASYFGITPNQGVTSSDVISGTLIYEIA